MVSQSHSRSDSRGGRGSNRGRGQCPQCTCCNRLGHTVINAISYIVDLPVLLIWLSLQIIQRVRVLSQGAHPHLSGSFLPPTNMKCTFV